MNITDKVKLPLAEEVVDSAILMQKSLGHGVVKQITNKLWKARGRWHRDFSQNPLKCRDVWNDLMLVANEVLEE